MESDRGGSKTKNDLNSLASRSGRISADLFSPRSARGEPDARDRPAKAAAQPQRAQLCTWLSQPEKDLKAAANQI